MPILGLTFSELKKVIGIVAILVGVAFFIGLYAGYEYGRSPNDPSKLSETGITEKQKQKNDESIEKIRQDSVNDSGPAPPSNNSNSETPQEKIKRLQKELRDLGEGTSSPNPKGKPSGQ